MSPIANWRAVLKHAWSVRLIVLSVLFSGLEVAVPLLQGSLPVTPGIFAGLCFLSTAAAGVARFVAQRKVDPPTADPARTDGEAE